MIDTRFEPAADDVAAGRVLTEVEIAQISMAISLKRIADALAPENIDSGSPLAIAIGNTAYAAGQSFGDGFNATRRT